MRTDLECPSCGRTPEQTRDEVSSAALAFTCSRCLMGSPQEAQEAPAGRLWSRPVPGLTKGSLQEGAIDGPKSQAERALDAFEAKVKAKVREKYEDVYGRVPTSPLAGVAQRALRKLERPERDPDERPGRRRRRKRRTQAEVLLERRSKTFCGFRRILIARSGRS
jgi:hypothetical protein